MFQVTLPWRDYTSSHLDAVDFSSPSLRNNNPRRKSFLYKGNGWTVGGSFIHGNNRFANIAQRRSEQIRHLKFLIVSKLFAQLSLLGPGTFILLSPWKDNSESSSPFLSVSPQRTSWWMLDIIISNSERRRTFVYTINTELLLNYKYKILLFGRTRRSACFLNASKIRIV